MNKIKIFFLILLVLLLLGINGILCGSFATGISEPIKLTISAGPVGGGWYNVAGTIAEIIKSSIPGSEVTVMTGGGVGNPTRLNEGKADVGFTQGGVYYAALNGLVPYKKKHTNVQGMLFLANLPMAWLIVDEDCPINSIEEIKEKHFPIKLGTTTLLSTPELASRRILAEYGITYDDIKSWGGKVTFGSYADIGNLIKDGHLDAYMGPVSSIPAMGELITTHKMKLLPVKEEAIDAVVEKYGYSKTVVPKGTLYFVSQDLPFLVEQMILVVRADLSDDIVYAVTKVICENAEAIREAVAFYKVFDPAKAFNISGGPLHPGAEKYFKDAGYIK